MRVVYFSNDYSVHDRRILQAITDQGQQVYFMCMAEIVEDGTVGPLPGSVLPVRWNNRGWPLGAIGLALRIRRLLKQIQPDLVHAGPVQQPALLIALSGYRPLVTMSWGSDLLVGARQRIGRWAARYAIARSELMFCDCEVVRQAAVALGMPEQQIVVFPWGVDLQLFSPDGRESLRRELGWEDCLVMISTRAWEPLLGVDQLVEGFIQAAQELPQCRLLLLNQGSMEATIRGRLAQEQLEDRVHFAGIVAQHDLPRFYRAADCYASASHSDGSSISLLEAMACGLPAVVSDIPGNLEWIEHGSNGWVFEDGQPERLAQIIAQAAGANGRLKQMGERSRAIAEQRADWRVNARRMLEAYQLAVNPEIVGNDH